MLRRVLRSLQLCRSFLQLPLQHPHPFLRLPGDGQLRLAGGSRFPGSFQLRASFQKLTLQGSHSGLGRSGSCGLCGCCVCRFLQRFQLLTRFERPLLELTFPCQCALQLLL